MTDDEKDELTRRERVKSHIEHAGELEFNEGTNKFMRPIDLEGKKTVSMRKKEIPASDIFKIVGLVGFFVLMAVTMYFLWPYVKEIFEPGGTQNLIARIREAGFAGVGILFGVQLLQVIVAFIPGEVTAVVAGMLYGPWLGGLLILVGGAVASAIVYWIVHLLGAPFVQDLVPKGFLAKFEEYERNGKFSVIVFVLFLIPGLPKDVFTYIIGLTDMKCSTFVLLSTVARAPGVLVTTYAASGIATGDYMESIIIFAVFAAIAVVGLIFRDKIMEAIGAKKEVAKEKREERKEEKAIRKEEKAAEKAEARAEKTACKEERASRK